MAQRTKVRRSAAAPHAEMAGRIRAARAATGLSAAQMARKLKAKTSTYYSWESGARAPRPGDMPRVAATLGISVGKLFGEAA